jgi:hypothetical protein
LLFAAAIVKTRTKAGTLARELSDAGVWTNAFLSTVSLLPIPGIDGGPILKWALVAQGKTPEQADGVVRKTNGMLSCGLSLASFFAFARGKRILGGFLAMLGMTALAVALGWLQEA